nr:MAG TPA: hypothetical protein [Caudoviricetes sp.]
MSPLRTRGNKKGHPEAALKIKNPQQWRVYVLICCSVRFTVPSLPQFKHFLAHYAT